MSYDPARFEMLMDRYHALDDRETDYAHELLAKALTCAPPEIQRQMDAKLKELDLLPRATYCDDAGNPLFTAQQVAEKVGVPVEEVERRHKKMIEDDPELFTPVGNIHRLQ